MVEGIKPFVNGMNAARVSIAQREANAANERAEIKENGAMNAVVTVVARLNQANERISEQDAEIARLKDVLALETADVAGRKAQFDAFKTQHPDSPLLAASGRRFKDGDAKTKARLIYEAAFDKKAREMGIANPADRRQD